MRSLRWLGMIPAPVYRRARELRWLRRLGARVLDALIEPGRMRPVRIEAGSLKGEVLELDPRINKDMVLGRYEPAVVGEVESRLGPGDVAYDVGAHLGYLTLIMARAVSPDGRVVAVEPDPEVAARLRRNVGRSPWARVVEIVEAAVAARPGRARFARSATGGTGSIDARGELVVDCATLDGLWARFGAPNLVKVDVEGREMDVLEGAAGLLASKRVALVLEAHSGEAASRCRNLLQQAGYSCRHLSESPRTVHLLGVPGPP